MDEKVRQEKLKMWKGELVKLEDQLKVLMVKKGEAAREGDLRENAAYQMAIEDGDTTRVRISQVKKIIGELESSGKSQGRKETILVSRL